MPDWALVWYAAPKAGGCACCCVAWPDLCAMPRMEIWSSSFRWGAR